MERFSDHVFGRRKGNTLDLFNTPSTDTTKPAPKPAAPTVKRELTPEAVEAAKDHLQSIMEPEEYEDYQGTDSWASDIDAILEEWGYELSERNWCRNENLSEF
jgi:hypothetical protein